MTADGANNMNFRRLAGRTANKLLRRIGLVLSPIDMDFEARLVSEKRLDRIFSEIAETASGFFASQTILPVNRKFDFRAETERFYELYLSSPFRRKAGGSRIGNLLWLDLMAKVVEPNLVVDSGTYMGASAWAMSQGAPQARILSFDIDLSNLALRAENVEYIERDWTSMDYDGLDRGNSLCYFDDHVDQGRRLKEAASRGFPFAIFDDDFSIYSFAAMAHRGDALPKISFLLDETLEHGELIEWVEGTRRFSWKVDRTELDPLRDLIGAEARLPNLGEILAIDQLPYRVVAIKSPVESPLAERASVAAN
jgi:hypothetical protein